MDQTDDELFAGATLAVDQDRRVERSDARRQLEDVLHAGAHGDEVLRRCLTRNARTQQLQLTRAFVVGGALSQKFVLQMKLLFIQLLGETVCIRQRRGGLPQFLVGLHRAHSWTAGFDRRPPRTWPSWSARASLLRRNGDSGRGRRSKSCRRFPRSRQTGSITLRQCRALPTAKYGKSRSGCENSSGTPQSKTVPHGPKSRGVPPPR